MSDEEAEQGGEGRGKMLQRHKRELKALKDATTKAAKVKDKAAKREAEARGKADEEALLAKHAAELAALDGGAGPTGSDDKEAVADVNVDEETVAEDLMPGNEKKGPSKAQKRREKKEKEAAALRKQREEEMKDVPNYEEIEKNRMDAQLAEVGLKIVDIPADGNCLYRAVAHQLAFLGAAQQPDHEALRGLCADHMQAHADDYLPFLEEEFASPEGFDKYLAQVRGTEWGGQHEIRAMSELLGHPIKVYQGKGDPIIDIGDSRKSPLSVSFHKYLYSNAHYNALVPR